MNENTATRFETEPKGGKAVKSTDPRKEAIVAALKAASGATKITSVKVLADGTATGNCLAVVQTPYRFGFRRHASYTSLGWFVVPAPKDA